MSTEERLDFRVKSSSGNGEYLVVAWRAGTRLRLTCNCDAGLSGMHCKHRVDLINGSVKMLASTNAPDVETLISWAKGTPVEAAVAEVANSERDLEVAKRKLATAKKRLAAVFVSGLAD